MIGVAESPCILMFETSSLMLAQYKRNGGVSRYEPPEMSDDELTSESPPKHF